MEEFLVSSLKREYSYDIKTILNDNIMILIIYRFDSDHWLLWFVVSLLDRQQVLLRLWRVFDRGILDGFLIYHSLDGKDVRSIWLEFCGINR